MRGRFRPGPQHGKAGSLSQRKKADGGGVDRDRDRNRRIMTGSRRR